MRYTPKGCEHRAPWRLQTYSADGSKLYGVCSLCRKLVTQELGPLWQTPSKEAEPVYGSPEAHPHG